MLRISLKRCFHTSLALSAKKPSPAGRIAMAAIVPEPEPVSDANILATKCCGLNYMANGQDPELKPDEEYPEWLWSVHTGKPKTYRDMDPNTREYWYALEKAKKEVEEKSAQGKGFYNPPEAHELQYISRLPQKKKVKS